MGRPSIRGVSATAAATSAVALAVCAVIEVSVGDAGGTGKGGDLEATSSQKRSRFLVIRSASDGLVRLIKVRPMGKGLVHTGQRGVDVFETMDEAFNRLSGLKGPETTVHFLATFRSLIGGVFSVLGTYICGITEVDPIVTIGSHSIMKVVHSRWYNVDTLPRSSPEDVLQDPVISMALEQMSATSQRRTENLLSDISSCSTRAQGGKTGQHTDIGGGGSRNSTSLGSSVKSAQEMLPDSKTPKKPPRGKVKTPAPEDSRRRSMTDKKDKEQEGVLGIQGSQILKELADNKWTDIEGMNDAIKQYLSGVEGVLGFEADEIYFFCDTLDLTHPFPSHATTPAPDFPVNELLASPFTELGIRQCCVVLLQGVVKSKVLTLSRPLTTHTDNTGQENIETIGVTPQNNRCRDRSNQDEPEEAVLLLLTRRANKPILTKDECLGYCAGLPSFKGRSKVSKWGRRLDRESSRWKRSGKNIGNNPSVLPQAPNFTLQPAHTDLLPRRRRQSIYVDNISYSSTDIVLFSPCGREGPGFWASSFDSMIPPSALISEMLFMMRDDGNTSTLMNSASNKYERRGMEDNDDISSCSHFDTQQSAAAQTPHTPKSAQTTNTNNTTITNNTLGVIRQRETEAAPENSDLIGKVINGIAITLLGADLQPNNNSQQQPRRVGNRWDVPSSIDIELVALISLKLSGMLDPCLSGLPIPPVKLLSTETTSNPQNTTEKCPMIHIFCENYNPPSATSSPFVVLDPPKLKGKVSIPVTSSRTSVRDSIADICWKSFMDEYVAKHPCFKFIHVSDMQELGQTHQGIQGRVTTSQIIKHGTIEESDEENREYLGAKTRIEEIEAQQVVPLILALTDRARITTMNHVFCTVQAMIKKLMSWEGQSTLSQPKTEEKTPRNTNGSSCSKEECANSPEGNSASDNSDKEEKSHDSISLEVSIPLEDVGDSKSQWVPQLEHTVVGWAVKLFLLENSLGVSSSLSCIDSLYPIANAPGFLGLLLATPISPVTPSSPSGAQLSQHLDPNKLCKLVVDRNAFFHVLGLTITSTSHPTSILCLGDTKCLVKLTHTHPEPIHQEQMGRGHGSSSPFVVTKYLPGIVGGHMTLPQIRHNEAFHKFVFAVPPMAPLSVNIELQPGDPFRSMLVTGGVTLTLQVPLCQEFLLPTLTTNHNSKPVWFTYNLDLATDTHRDAQFKGFRTSCGFANIVTVFLFIDQLVPLTRAPRISFTGLSPCSRSSIFVLGGPELVLDYGPCRRSAFIEGLNTKLIGGVGLYAEGSSAMEESEISVSSHSVTTEQLSRSDVQSDNRESISERNISSAASLFIEDLEKLAGPEGKPPHEVPECLATSELLVRLWNRKNKNYPRRTPLAASLERRRARRCTEATEVTDDPSHSTSSTLRSMTQERSERVGVPGTMEIINEGQVEDKRKTTSKARFPKRLDIGGQKGLDELKEHIMVPVSTGNRLMLARYPAGQGVVGGTATLGTSLQLDKLRVQGGLAPRLANVIARWTIQSLAGYSRLTPEMSVLPVKYVAKKTTRCRRCDCSLGSTGGEVKGAIWELDLQNIDGLCQQCSQIEKFLEAMLSARDDCGGCMRNNEQYKGTLVKHITSVAQGVGSPDQYKVMIRGHLSPCSHSDLYADALGYVNVWDPLGELYQEQVMIQGQPFTPLLNHHRACFLIHPLTQSPEDIPFDCLLTGGSLCLHQGNTIHVSLAFFNPISPRWLQIQAIGAGRLTLEWVDPTTLEFFTLTTTTIDALPSTTTTTTTTTTITNTNTNTNINTNLIPLPITSQPIQLLVISVSVAGCFGDTGTFILERLNLFEAVRGSGSSMPNTIGSPGDADVLLSPLMPQPHFTPCPPQSTSTPTPIPIPNASQSQVNEHVQAIPVMIIPDVVARRRWPGGIESLDLSFKQSVPVQGIALDYTPVARHMALLGTQSGVAGRLVSLVQPKEMRVVLYNTGKPRKAKEKVIGDEHLMLILPPSAVRVFRLTLPLIDVRLLQGLKGPLLLDLDRGNGVVGTRATVEFLSTYTRGTMGVTSKLLPSVSFF